MRTVPNPKLPKKIIQRWLGTLFIIGIVSLISLSFTPSAMGQTVSTTNFGVGRGHGTEIGINIDTINSLRGGINSGAYDRLCTAAEHDPNKWHSLVNIEAGCHYDHHHGDDPNYVNDIFGEAGNWFSRPGQSVSYPWQTFGAATMTEQNDVFVANKRMENDLKHEGYIWVVRRDQPCSGGNCITDFRVQIHGIFGAHDAVVRWHSFSYEGRVCTNGADSNTCGIVRHGGWMDFGRLFITPPDDLICGAAANEIFIPLSADTLYMPLDRVEARDEIRCHATIVTLRPQPDQSISPLEWWGLQRGRLRVQLRGFDPIGNIDPQAPDKWHFYCTMEDVNCRYDQTLFDAFIGYVYAVPEFVDFCALGCMSIDPDNNDRTNYIGYTDRFGQLAPNCTAVALDCVPLEYNNVPLNASQGKEGKYTHAICRECPKFDHDISPAGKKWNTWFFTKYANGGGHGQMTPQPTVNPTVEPTLEPTPLPVGAAVIVEVTPATAMPGETVNVAFKLSNVANLYGLQAECQVDPAVLTGTTRTNGDAFVDGSSFYIDTGFQPDGKWTVAASLLQPSTPISGSLTGFTIAYNVLAAGEDNLACSILAVDQNGMALDVQVINGQLSTTPTPAPTAVPTTEVTAEPTLETPVETIEPSIYSTVSGLVAFQNRPDNSGILARLYSSTLGQVGEVTTDAAGTFTFADVAAGEYTIILTAPQHIPAMVSVLVGSDGMAVDAGSTTLYSGDTDDNGTVDVLDATFVGANFGVDTPPAPANADLNADLTINITDLVLVGGNFGAASPVAD